MENTKHPKRFNDAVSKLYNAFHFGELDKYDCKKCAVGNICGNSNWSEETLHLVEGIKKYGKSELFGNDIENCENTGYSAFELRKIEYVFMFGEIDNKIYHDGYKDPLNSKEQQFKGLCGVVKFLCELDNIPNIMDIQSLFETENDAPKKQLIEVLC